MSEEQMLSAIGALTQAAEARIKSETERASLELERLEIEQNRLRMERENNAVLFRILQDTSDIVDRIGHYSQDDHDKILRALESILSLTQVVALRVSGTELLTLIDTVKSVKGAAVQVTVNDKANVGNIVEGVQNIANTRNIDVELMDAIKAINNDDPQGVENVLNTLPEDAIDVALAALNGPIAAARMIARKVGDKWRVTRTSIKS